MKVFCTSHGSCSTQSQATRNERPSGHLYILYYIYIKQLKVYQCLQHGSRKFSMFSVVRIAVWASIVLKLQYNQVFLEKNLTSDILQHITKSIRNLGKVLVSTFYFNLKSLLWLYNINHHNNSG